VYGAHRCTTHVSAQVVLCLSASASQSWTCNRAGPSSSNLADATAFRGYAAVVLQGAGVITSAAACNGDAPTAETGQPKPPEAHEGPPPWTNHHASLTSPGTWSQPVEVASEWTALSPKRVGTLATGRRCTHTQGAFTPRPHLRRCQSPAKRVLSGSVVWVAGVWGRRVEGTRRTQARCGWRAPRRWRRRARAVPVREP
jgi:hypothetical protein